MISEAARADIVCRYERLLDVIECKRELSFDVLAQARAWMPFTNSVFVAVPPARRSAGRSEAIRVCRERGVGVLEVGDAGVTVVESAAVRVRASDALLEALRPEHKTHAKAGTNGGGYFTAFRATAEALAAHVDRYPGCTLTEAVAAIPHHYRSRVAAEEQLAKRIRKGLIPGVHRGWKKRLWSTAEEAKRGMVA